MKANDLPPWQHEADFDEVGNNVLRLDAGQKVTGRARYAGDMQLPGQLDGAIVRSPHARARILSVDVGPALDVDGVVAVLTAEDVGDLEWYSESTPFFSDIVRFVGDEIAAVAAETPEAARAGAAAVVVEYEVLDHVTDPVRAIDADAPRVHDVTSAKGANLVDEPEKTERGDVAAAFEGATVIIDLTFDTPVSVHNALETHGATAWWDGSQLTLYASTQGVNDVRDEIAERLGLDHNQVRVVAEHVGGAFGAKQVPWKPTMIGALLSKKTARPVRMMADRRGENIALGKRNRTRQRVRLAADEQGTLLGIDADLSSEVGAYVVGGESSMLAGLYLHLYKCANVRTVSRSIYTNTGPAVAFRAPGYVEAAFALESAMDQLATELDIDPVELRLRNYTERDQEEDLPWSAPDALRRSYERVKEVARWDDSPATPPTGDNGVRTGRGFAANEWAAATATPPGYAWLEMNSDGSVHVVCSAQDIGTGTRTVLTQVAAEELATDPAKVRLTLGDTAAGPPAPTSAGSTTVPTMAPAIRAAAADARQQILEHAAAQLDVEIGVLTLEGDTIKNRSGDDLLLSDLLQELAPQGIHGHGGQLETNEDVSVRTFGSASAEVTVDTYTGEVRVQRIVVAPDCGRILNRALADSQVIGGATQGIGFALTEEQIVDHELGVVINDSLEEFLIPTVSDSCHVEHAALDLPDLAANPLGVKGIGELPLIPVPAAIANAVHDAIGVRFTELPITRKRILDALNSAPTAEERP